MSLQYCNPYRGGKGEWIRGNFHGHSWPNSGCATVPLEEGVAEYHRLGADFVAVTDHDWVTDLAQVQANYPKLIFLQGFEHSRGGHMIFVGEHVPPLHELPLGEALARAGNLLTIVSHPQPRPEHPTWTLERLLALGRLPDGLEIYNGHYGLERMRVRGLTPEYTRFWDELLTEGYRLWGFADDDFHDPPDLDNAFNMVWVDRRTPAAVVGAAKSGRFYASTGLLLSEIEEKDDRLQVTLQEPAVGRFVGPGGQTLARSEGTSFQYRPTDERYVRFEAEAEVGQLYLQPIYQEHGLQERREIGRS